MEFTELVQALRRHSITRDIITPVYPGDIPVTWLATPQFPVPPSLSEWRAAAGTGWFREETGWRWLIEASTRILDSEIDAEGELTSRRVVCLDASAINGLLDLPDSVVVVTSLLDRFDVYITGLNVVEIARTRNVHRAELLRRLEKRLAKDYIPLDVPGSILHRLCRAHLAGARTMTITEDKAALWQVLSDAHSVTEDVRIELDRWTRATEEEFGATLRHLRRDFDEIIDRGSSPRPHSPSQLLTIYRTKGWRLAYETVSKIYKTATDRVLPLSRMDLFLESHPSAMAIALGALTWKIYWKCAWAPRPLARSGARPRRQNRACMMDLLSGIYLPFCDYFLTNDVSPLQGGGQYRALRWLNTLNLRQPRTQVMKLDVFVGRHLGVARQ